MALCSLLVFLYRLTAPTGTTPEDASEFILVAHKMGLAHPPGYPLFTWIGHFFSLLPLGTPAQKIAFLSHISVAVAAGILGACIFIRLHDLVWVAFAVLTFGLSPFVWESAQFVEVYPLHTALMAMFFFQSILIAETPEKSPSKMSSFFLGLTFGFALSNHYPLVVLAVPSLIMMLMTKRESFFRFSCVSWFLMGAVAGLLPYLHLVFVHHYSEFIFSDPIESVNQLFDYILRKEYAANNQSRTFSHRELILYSKENICMLFTAFTPVTFGFVGYFFSGGLKLKLKSPYIGSLILGLASSLLFLFLFWQPDYYDLAIELFKSFQGFALFCFILIGVEAMNEAQKKFNRREWFRFSVFFIPLLLFSCSFKKNNRRTDDFCRDYASWVLSALPPNSVLFTKGDTDAGILAYYHFLENKRPDVLLISQVAALLPSKPFSRAIDIPKQQHTLGLLNKISEAFENHRPVFTIGSMEYFNSDSHIFPFQTKNYGLFQEVYQTEQAPVRNFEKAVTGAGEFLTKAMEAEFEPNFVFYRKKLISDACHTLLIHRVNHEAFSVFPECKFLRGQWLHVEQQDYAQADGLFLEAIRGFHLAQNSELVNLGSDFIINRVKWVSTLPLNAIEQKQKLLKEGIQLTLPFALGLKVCKNKLAPKILELANQLEEAKVSQQITDTFFDCPWVQRFLLTR